MKRLAFSLLLLCGCLEENSLTGSMSEIFPLEVSKVLIHRNDEAIRVTYLRNRNINLDIVASITVSLHLPDGGVNAVDGGTLLPLLPGTRIDLAGEYALGHPKVSVVHAPGGEPARLLPPVQRGDFFVSTVGAHDEETAGDFSIVFKDTGGDIGFGRTLGGRFRAPTIDAGFGELP